MNTWARERMEILHPPAGRTKNIFIFPDVQLNPDRGIK
jgi:hypothetical protein